MSSKQNLTKATITPFDGTGQAGEKIEVLFNPEQYSINKSNQFSSVAIPGRSSPLIQFIRGEAETLTVDLFFDTYTYENGVDVRKKYIDKITNLLQIDSDLHAPPVCEFAWGQDFSFRGIIESANRRFTMFKEDGTPVRAVLSLTFRQYGEKKIPTHSPDRTKRRVVKEGDTLWLFAAREYGDPSKWRNIAIANNIDNPRILKPGTEIIIPPIE